MQRAMPQSAALVASLCERAARFKPCVYNTNVCQHWLENSEGCLAIQLPGREQILVREVPHEAVKRNCGCAGAQES